MPRNPLARRLDRAREALSAAAYALADASDKKSNVKAALVAQKRLEDAAFRFAVAALGAATPPEGGA